VSVLSKFVWMDGITGSGHGVPVNSDSYVKACSPVYNFSSTI
jgi:hypothetical protein